MPGGASDSGRGWSARTRLPGAEGLCQALRTETVSPRAAPTWFSKFAFTRSFCFLLENFTWSSSDVTERRKTDHSGLELHQVLLGLNTRVFCPTASLLLGLFLDQRSRQPVTGCADGQVRAAAFGASPDTCAVCALSQEDFVLFAAAVSPGPRLQRSWVLCESSSKHYCQLSVF